jgi:hypothetical protein
MDRYSRAATRDHRAASSDLHDVDQVIEDPEVGSVAGVEGDRQQAPSLRSAGRRLVSRAPLPGCHDDGEHSSECVGRVGVERQGIERRFGPLKAVLPGTAFKGIVALAERLCTAAG